MPQPDLARRGPSLVIEIGRDLVVVDAGPGTLYRLLEAGYSGREIRCIAITHLHSDHTTGLIDVLLAAWVGRWWDSPPILAGPPGTIDFVSGLLNAFDYDIGLRSAEGAITRDTLQPAVVEIEEGWSWGGGTGDDGWTIEAFRVDHHPVEHAFGFRFDVGDRKVVVSGDTRFCDNVVRYSQDADLLVHEVMWRPGLEQLIAAAPNDRDRARFQRILDYHTGAEEVGEIAARANVKKVVLTHVILPGGTPADLLCDVRKAYDGDVVVGEDLATFEIA